MQPKGVIFTLTLMMLGLTIFSLFALTQETAVNAEKQSAGLNSIALIINKETNLKSAVDATHHGIAMGIFERVNPLTHSINGNQIILIQNWPVQDTDVNTYFDMINLLRIFATDTNSERVFDGTQVDINTILGPGWGNISRAMNFIVLPQCLRYRILDGNTFWGGGSCTADFNLFTQTNLSLTVSPQEIEEDLNTFVCNFDGNIICPFVDMNASDPNPYFSVTVDDANCSACGFTSTTVKGHFDPSAINTIVISCQEVGGGVCDSEDIEIILGSNSAIARASTRQITIQTVFTYEDNIKRFVSEDVNFLLTKSGYNTSKRWIR